MKEIPAKWLRRMHALLTVGFLSMIPVTMYTSLKTSIAYIAFLSVLSPALSEFSSWQSARVEVKQDEQSTEVNVGSDTHVEVQS